MKNIKTILVMLLIFAVTACGGGGSSPAASTAIATLSGTAATGKAIPNTTVIIRGRGVNDSATATTDANGKYTKDVSGFTPPYVLKVAHAGTYLYSVATTTGTANIHPYTDMIVRNAFKGADPDTASVPTSAEINASETSVRHNVLATSLANSGAGSTFNLLTTPFDANGNGFDNVLDNTRVTIAGNSVTVTATDPVTGGTSTLATGNLTTTNLIPADTTNPSDPTGLTASPATTTSILLAWTASTDDVGVAGYNVYRDGSKIAASATPSYSDSGLTNGTSYCYQVEAYDASGKLSAKHPVTATVVCNSPATAADTTPPSAPTNLAATAISASRIDLIWSASADNVGVVGYDIYRGASKIATAKGTSYSDTNGLASNTLYTYTVKAKDAALNVSAASNTASATTLPGIPAAPTGVIATASNGQVTNGQVTVSWTAVSGATSYKLYLGTQAGVTINGTVTPGVTSPHVHTGLTNGTPYYFVVTAANASGESIISNEVTATPVAPATHSISGTVTLNGATGVTVNVYNMDTHTAQDVVVATGGNYTVSVPDGTYILTPNAQGYSFTPPDLTVTLSGGNLTGKDFTATVLPCPTCVVSGTVTGPWVEGVGITISTTSSAGGSSSTPYPTDANGRYSISVPAGTYTVTPSLAGYTYTPAVSQQLNVSGPTTQDFTASSVINSFTISGTVTNSSSAVDGPIAIAVYEINPVTLLPICDCHAVAGTVISGPGSYRVRGLDANRTYKVLAEMDAQTPHTGLPNANNPVGMIPAVPVTNSDLLHQDIVIGNRAAPPAVAPALDIVVPADSSAFILYTVPQDANREETATKYTLYWGADATATGGTKTFKAQGINMPLMVDGLTNGSQLYFKLSMWVGGTESAKSAAFGPVPIGATTGANTVSGTATLPSAPPAAATLYVGVYSNSGLYVTRIPSPVSQQAYSISGVPNGSYSLFAILDTNNNGVPDFGDINIANGNALSVTVSGNTVKNFTLSPASATARIETDHWSNGDPAFDSYNLSLSLQDGTKRAVAMTMISGSGVAVPRDMINDRNYNYSDLRNRNSTRPQVGDAYKFRMTYFDGIALTTTDATSDLTGSVTAVLDTFASISPANVNTAAPYSRTVPQINWVAPNTAPTALPYLYHIGVGGWWYPAGNGLPSTTLSAAYNADGRANPASLTPNTPYDLLVQVRDANRNTATFKSPSPYTP